MMCMRTCVIRIKGNNSLLHLFRKSYPVSSELCGRPCLMHSNRAYPQFFVQWLLRGTLKVDFVQCHTQTDKKFPSGIRYPQSGNVRIVRENEEDIGLILEEHDEKIHGFARFLGCSEEEMRDLVRKDTRIVTCYGENKVYQTISLLKKYGFNETEILSNPPAFCLSIHSLTSRLKEMKSVRCNKLYVLKYGRKRFLEILEFYEKERLTMKGFASRETFLAALFGCEEPEILEKADDFPHVLSYPARRLVDAYNLLIEYGFTTEDVFSDLGTLGLPPSELKYRLDKMNSVGMLNKENVFPLLHFIRKDQFEGSVQCWVEDRTALEGHEDKTSFLCWRLNCQPKDVERMYMWCSVLKSSRPKRVKALLDILLDDMGIPASYIITRPSVFVHSAKRLTFRHSVLSERSIRDPNTILENLSLSEAKFAKKFNLKLEQ